jgi:hypothetical protein
LEAFPDHSIEIVEAEEIGDVVLTALLAVAHSAGSVLSFADRVWHASEWRGGLVARLQHAGSSTRGRRVAAVMLTGELASVSLAGRASSRG